MYSLFPSLFKFSPFYYYLLKPRYLLKILLLSLETPLFIEDFIIISKNLLFTEDFIIISINLLFTEDLNRQCSHNVPMYTK